MFARAAIALAVLLAACGPAPAPVTPGQDEVAPAATPASKPAEDPGRPAEDIARDELRKPQEVMDFFGIGPGDRVAELMSGAGYYVEVLSRRVGPEGAVWAHNTPFVLKRYAEQPFTERLKSPALANVTRLDTELEDPKLPGDLDAVIMVLFFHDLYWQGVDRAAMLKAIHAALAPDGVFGVIDHSALPGHGASDVETLHRVEEALVVEEIEAAGFRLVERAELLRHPEDTRDYNVFDPPAGRDRTDRFVLKFQR